MVCVAVCDEDMVDVGHVHIHVLENSQNAVAAACVRHEKFPVLFYGKARIITPCHSGVTGSEYI